MTFQLPMRRSRPICLAWVMIFLSGMGLAQSPRATPNSLSESPTAIRSTLPEFTLPGIEDRFSGNLSTVRPNLREVEEFDGGGWRPISSASKELADYGRLTYGGDDNDENTEASHTPATDGPSLVIDPNSIDPAIGPGIPSPAGSFNDPSFAAETSPSQEVAASDGMPFEYDDDWEQILEDETRLAVIEPEKGTAPFSSFGLSALMRERYASYRREDASITYLPGDGDQLGWLSFASSNYLKRKQASGFTTNINFHLLSGPQAVALPPRLYDFELGYQRRKRVADCFSYDCSVNIGLYSDFEDSARDGIRYPGHAVGMFHRSPEADWVFGVDYLSRDDIKILPVFGFCWHHGESPAVRYECIFPRPRIDFALSNQCRWYVAGLLGGGTWDIEFPDDSNDVMTYRDYRCTFGLEKCDEHGNLSAWELAWVFSRNLEFRSRSDQQFFDDALMIRYVVKN
jgi:hypothetical protein